MATNLHVDPESGVPLYRQLYQQIRDSIELGLFGKNERLPATRELAGQLGLNRTTVSAAYALLESEGFIQGQVGRGSFVAPRAPGREPISFESSRPSEEHFPMAEFQACCHEVIASGEASSVLQLGSPAGYGPLRRYLLDRAREQGLAGPADDILITSGCQQAIDLVQRTLAPPGDTAVVEDPTYHGIKNVFLRGGTRLSGIPIGEAGLDLARLERSLAVQRPSVLVLTPNFQNPTGVTLNLDSRRDIAHLAQRAGVLAIENDIYGDLRYHGDAVPTLKEIEGSNTLLLRSFSKVAFPGLRVGWLIGPRGIVARLTETKRWCDLHSDQLSQAILLRFAESGRLEDHLKQVRMAGAQRLQAALSACGRHLPAGAEYTRPLGGMNLWVTLPAPHDSTELLAAAQREHLAYLPGPVFAIERDAARSLRLSFGGLSPEDIAAGIERLGAVFRKESSRERISQPPAAAPAIV